MRNFVAPNLTETDNIIDDNVLVQRRLCFDTRSITIFKVRKPIELGSIDFTIEES